MAIVFLLLVFSFSGWQIYSTLSEYKQSEESYELLTQEYVSEKVPAIPANEDETEATGTEALEIEPKETAPIAVDFDALNAECSDVVGWIYCPDTVVNYPVARGEDNSYYLTRLPDGTWNSSGCIFMDYRCARDISSWNSILYGHNMQNGSMFAILQKYKNQEFYEEHPVWYFLTPEQDYKIVLIGGYTVPGSDKDTYGIPGSSEERDVLIERARQNSTFQTDVEISETDKLTTLSTCAYEYDGARYVLVGVLRELAPSLKGGETV